jgi:hypothetical protein
LCKLTLSTDIMRELAGSHCSRLSLKAQHHFQSRLSTYFVSSIVLLSLAPVVVDIC